MQYLMQKREKKFYASLKKFFSCRILHRNAFNLKKNNKKHLNIREAVFFQFHSECVFENIHFLSFYTHVSFHSVTSLILQPVKMCKTAPSARLAPIALTVQTARPIRAESGRDSKENRHQLPAQLPWEKLHENSSEKGLATFTKSLRVCVDFRRVFGDELCFI